MNRGCYIVGFWDRVEVVIGKTGLSKKQIAKRMGVGRKVLNFTRYDDRCLSALSLIRFCSVTGVSADWLLGLTYDKSDKLVDALNAYRSELTDSEADRLKLEGAVELVSRYGDRGGLRDDVRSDSRR